MTTLIIAELHHDALHPATAVAVSAAAKLGADVHVLVAGGKTDAAAADAAALTGVSKVWAADAPHYAHALPENIAPLIVSLAKAQNYSHILMTATTTGKDILPRAAALLDAPQISEVTEIISATTFKHPIYAGNAFETVEVTAPTICLTVRQTAFSAAAKGGNAERASLPTEAASTLSEFVSAEENKSTRPELTQARVVVSGGRGLGSKENFALIESLADKLGAAIGASRAAVDAGYVPNDYQVGQTGKIVAPELYIAVGISGAIQHLAGMKDSKVIVAINKDENAAIFELADYGLVGDLFTILPELEKAL